MLLKKFKKKIYILLLILFLIFILPLYSFAIDEDSIYVWSNTSSSITTSNNLNNETKSPTIENNR